MHLSEGFAWDTLPRQTNPLASPSIPSESRHSELLLKPAGGPIMSRILGCVCLTLIGGASAVPAAGIQSFSDETQFQQAVGVTTVESFNQFPVGSLPQTTLLLGNVTVTLTLAGSALIFGPGSFGFTTNFLSTGVQDGDNNVLITFPTGTRGGGIKIVSVFPVTVTATSASAESSTVVFSASQVSFLGFVADSGLTQVRISSPAGTGNTPIVNLGDISHGGPAPTPTPTPISVPGDPSCGQVGFLGCPTSSRDATLSTADCPLGDGSYYDLFQFAGTTGQTVTIRMTSTTFDTFLFLLDPNNATVATDDDSGGGTNSLLTFILPSTGRWQIVANSFDATQFGPYSLSLTCSGGIGPTATPLGGSAPADIPTLSFPMFALFCTALASAALFLIKQSRVG